MSDTVIRVEGVSKQYRLGTVGTGTLSHDLNRWWHRVRGKPDPYLKVTHAQERAHAAAAEYVWALRNVEFEAARGEVLGIIGRNGAGKSTLLKILSRVTAPTVGKVKIRGSMASLLEVGTGFHLELTGRENIYLNGAILGMSRPEITSKLDEIVAFSGCERYLDTPVKRYSSGMIVRLGFAVAAHLEPDILIVDEVLAVGDAEFQKQCIGKMQDVAGHGRTVLFVSHNMAAVEALCGSAIWLDNGQIVQRGAVRDVVAAYSSHHGCGSGPVYALGREYLSRVTLLDADGHPRSVCLPMDSLHIRMDIRVPRALRCPRIGIGLNDELGRRVATVDTFFSGFEIPEISDERTVTCCLPRLGLSAGKYSLTICVRNEQENLDVSEGEVVFEIANSDVFGTGRMPSPAQGPLLIEPSWRNEGGEAGHG